MHYSTEIRIVEIARRFLMLSLQANREYHTRQGTLGLAMVLSQERLETAEGTALSLGALASLAALTAAHKAAFQTVMLTAAAEMAAASALLPQPLRGQYHTKFLETTQWQLDAQSRFYAGREHWLTTATEICMLVESCRPHCTFSARGVDFHDEDKLGLFDALTARLNDARVIEEEACELRRERMRESLAVLGLPTSA